jgi:hypothetical protein
VQYIIAAAVLDWRVTLDSFRDDVVLRPKVQALMRKVSAVEDPGIRDAMNPAAHGYVTVEIRANEGQQFTRRIEYHGGLRSCPSRIPTSSLSFGIAPAGCSGPTPLNERWPCSNRSTVGDVDTLVDALVLRGASTAARRQG